MSTSKKPFSLILIVIIIISFSMDINGQDVRKIKRLTSHVEFDGIPNEQSWKEPDTFPLSMHRPNFGAQPTEKNDARIGYDDGFLWISASLYMEDASKIFTVTKKRDEMLFD